MLQDSTRSVSLLLLLAGVAQVAHATTSVLIDDEDAAVLAAHRNGTGTACIVETYSGTFLNDAQGEPGTVSATYAFDLPFSGCYLLEEWHPRVSPGCRQRLAASTRTHVHYGDGSEAYVVSDLTINGGQWNALGVLPFYQHVGAIVQPSNTGKTCAHEENATDCLWVADAVRMTWQSAMNEFGGCDGAAAGWVTPSWTLPPTEPFEVQPSPWTTDAPRVTEEEDADFISFTDPLLTFVCGIAVSLLVLCIGACLWRACRRCRKQGRAVDDKQATPLAGPETPIEAPIQNIEKIDLPPLPPNAREAQPPKIPEVLGAGQQPLGCGERAIFKNQDLEQGMDNATGVQKSSDIAAEGPRPFLKQDTPFSNATTEEGSVRPRPFSKQDTPFLSNGGTLPEAPQPFERQKTPCSVHSYGASSQAEPSSPTKLLLATFEEPVALQPDMEGAYGTIVKIAL